MTSIILMAIAVCVVTALSVSVVIQFMTPISDSGLSPLEKNCQRIADEGYKIHALYPDSSPDELLDSDFKRLMYLDELWMKECVSVLPADSVFSIVNNVERNLLHGE